MDNAHLSAATDYIDHGSDTYTFLKDPVVDALVEVVIELGSQAWITRRRLLVLERVMAASGILASEAIETYVPTAEDAAAWRAERDKMMRSVYAALARRPTAGAEAAERAKMPDAPKKPPRNSAPAGERAMAKGASGI
jgi:hypothetical protein